jgi:hypothetical protein
MPIRDRLTAAASRAADVASSEADTQDNPRARDVARDQLAGVDGRRAVQAARRLGQGAQIETDTGSKLSREERQSFERAEEATRTAAPVDATLDPVSRPEQLERYAASGRRSDASTADDLVFASTPEERQRPDRRRGDGFARRDMLKIQAPLRDPDGSPASTDLGVGLAFTDGVPDTAPETNDMDELVVYDPDAERDTASMGWF